MARPKHRTKTGGTYFVTTDTWQRQRIFQNREAARLLEETIFKYREDGFFYVHRHVVMPEHLHLILTPGETTTLEKAIQLIKGGSSHELGKSLGRRFPVWRAGFTEHQIRDEADYEAHVRYIDANPVKAHLAEKPEDYPYCAAYARVRLDPWPVASGAKARGEGIAAAAGLKPRPSEGLFRIHVEGRDFSPADKRSKKRGALAPEAEDAEAH